MENLFRYKAWANAELLDSVEKINFDKYPDEGTMAIRLFNHTHVVDKIFIAHLNRENHVFDADNTIETPSVESLRLNVRFSDKWLVDYVSELEHGALQEIVHFNFTDNDAGSMSREEILNHLIIHGGYHRGNIGMLLTSCGLDRAKDTFTRFLHALEPNRRIKS